ncbi:MAG: T9SS type A sorting domain-containing protein [Ignavibacteriales bacterium]|nr:MAG: T9SS type A sorting domain-containing protein [Ignavibacteriaceae bacterium]MBW7873813.1 T9SS type A sorting domain-containing protein [Ignavibacteria bacterium]MCZ2144150.1 T9SS type A sorting domain-containing protein [Ignavibacteriales bacterium]OQY76271.1 MAG: hypothetical protein B6D45_04145 [Ignavibacteriales bacterium UTCHB3]MBV6445789.1 hypothetical protein [Ignavibacteriaceae bacterium]
MRRNFSILISAISIILLTICSFGFAGSQTGTLPTDEYQQYKIQNIKNATSNTTSPEEARKWFIDQRKSMTGNIPDNWREDAMENIRKFNIRPDGIEGVNELQWQEVGPNNFGGRVLSLLVHPTNPSIIYIGTVSSGIRKTTNGGYSWSDLYGDVTSNGSGPNGAVVTALAIAKGNSTVLMMGMSHGAVRIYGNIGEQWEDISAGLHTGYITKVAIHPTDLKTAYVTFSGFAVGKKIYKTTDKGGSWTNISSNLPNIPVNAFAIHPLEPSILYAGTDLVNYNQAIANIIPGWNKWDVSAQNIEVSGDFFVGLIYNGLDRPAFGYNTNNNGRAWDFDGTNWTMKDETYFIRALVKTTTAMVEFDNTTPAEFKLLQNYPNPFNPSTVIRFSLPEATDMSLTIYDISGKKVVELVNSMHQPGNYSYTWNGKNEYGRTVASGVYLCTIKAGNNVQTVKMIFQK